MNNNPFKAPRPPRRFNNGDIVKSSSHPRHMTVTGYERTINDDLESIYGKVICIWPLESGKDDHGYFSEDDLILVKGTVQNAQ